MMHLDDEDDSSKVMNGTLLMNHLDDEDDSSKVHLHHLDDSSKVFHSSKEMIHQTFDESSR